MAWKLVGPKGKVVSIDLREMDPLAGVEFVQGDFTEERQQRLLLERIGGPVDVILSDMAPDFCGDQLTDHLRTLHLCYQVRIDGASGGVGGDEGGMPCW